MSISWFLISVLGYWASSVSRGIKLPIFLSNEGNQAFLEKLVIQKHNLEHLLVLECYVVCYKHTSKQWECGKEQGSPVEVSLTDAGRMRTIKKCSSTRLLPKAQTEHLSICACVEEGQTK